LDPQVGSARERLIPLPTPAAANVKDGARLTPR
jgi:hypothetical protein